MDATSIDDIINYHFRSEALRNEATLASGASVSDVNINGLAQGNKVLALIGDALIRLVIVDQGYVEGATTGEQHS
jgi:ribonuclease-3